MALKKRPVNRPVNRRDDADVPAEGLRLWAPWRYAYLRSLLSDPKACIFCFGALSDAERRERLILFENRDVFVMLNKYPYSNGHIMVAPRGHVASPEMLTRSDRALLGDAVAASIKAMRENLHPQALNVGANLGSAAGAGFAEHLHWHIVPRWTGDTNFMTTVSETRLEPEDLSTTYTKLRKALGF